jgi:hypothetical protein
VQQHADEELNRDEIAITVGVFCCEVNSHRSLWGWHLDPEVLAFLVAIEAKLGVDEYG